MIAGRRGGGGIQVILDLGKLPHNHDAVHDE